MEIRDFLNKFQTITDAMSEKELREWLHEYARKLPESRRGPLLESLQVEPEQFKQEEIDQAMFWASDWFDDVEERQKIVYFIQDEEVNEWDWAYEPGAEFEGIEDRDGVLPEFTRVLEIID